MIQQVGRLKAMKLGSVQQEEGSRGSEHHNSNHPELLAIFNTSVSQQFDLRL